MLVSERRMRSGNESRLSCTNPLPLFSITKSLVGASASILSARGEVEIDGEVGRHFPQWEEMLKGVTLRHLLQHSGGIPCYGAVPSYHQDVKRDPAHPWSEEKFLEMTLPKGLDFLPGKGWNYSNTGYLMVRLILEEIMGCSLQEIFSQLLFVPHSLQDTSVLDTQDDLLGVTPGYSRLWTGEKGAWLDARKEYHPGWVGHGLVASPLSECVRLFRALFSGGMSSDAFGLWTESVPVGLSHKWFKDPSYALGLISDPQSDWGPLYGHGGEGPGWTTLLLHAPEAPEGATTVAGWMNGPAGDGLERLAQKLLKS